MRFKIEKFVTVYQALDANYELLKEIQESFNSDEMGISAGLELFKLAGLTKNNSSENSEIKGSTSKLMKTADKTNISSMFHKMSQIKEAIKIMQLKHEAVCQLEDSYKAVLSRTSKALKDELSPVDVKFHGLEVEFHDSDSDYDSDSEIEAKISKFMTVEEADEAARVQFADVVFYEDFAEECRAHISDMLEFLSIFKKEGILMYPVNFEVGKAYIINLDAQIAAFKNKNTQSEMTNSPVVSEPVRFIFNNDNVPEGLSSGSSSASSSGSYGQFFYSAPVIDDNNEAKKQAGDTLSNMGAPLNGSMRSK